MATFVSNVSKHPPGYLNMTVTTVTGAEESTEGGEAVTAADVGLDRVEYGFAVLKTQGELGVTSVFYDYTNNVLKYYEILGEEVEWSEVPKEKDLSETEAVIFAFGK